MPDLIPADDLLARTLRTYAALESYSDQGELTCRIETGDGAVPPTLRRISFLIRWRRPESLRFEFREMQDGPELEWPKYVIWSRPDGVSRWWTIKPTVKQSSGLDLALAAAAGVSRGLSAMIPNLLRGRAEEAGVPTEPMGFRGEVVQLDAARCVRVPMQLGELHRRLWIEADTALILRCDELHRLSADRSKQLHEEILQRSDSGGPGSPLDPDAISEIRESSQAMLRRGSRYPLTFLNSARYHPVVNPVLDDSDFEFTPPTA